MFFLCKHMLDSCVWLLCSCFASIAALHFFRKPCQVKRISTFAHSAAYQCQFQNSGPIRRPWRQGKHHKLLFTVATVLFDGSMAEEAFCAALFLKPFLSTASWSKLMIKWMMKNFLNYEVLLFWLLNWFEFHWIQIWHPLQLCEFALNPHS